MKIEILKSAKGNHQKQNKPAKSPKPRWAHMPKETNTKERKATKRLAYKPAKHETAPLVLFIFLNRIEI